MLPPTTADAPLRSAHDTVGLLEQTINQVRRGELDAKVANAVGYLIGLLLKALQETETERRLSALEAALRLHSFAQPNNLAEDDDEWTPPPGGSSGNDENPLE